MVEFCSFHEGSLLGTLERACLSSFRTFGHSLKLYCYEELDAPPGVILADAREILPVTERNAFFQQSPGRLSQFSNGFRYAMLYTQGGWWVDTDVLCIGPNLPDRDVVLGWASNPDLNRARVGTAIIKLPENHELARRAYEYWRENWQAEAFGVTGPKLLTKLVRELEMTSIVMPFGTLFRIPWNEILLLFDRTCTDEAKALLDGCALLHLANSGLGFTGLTRNILPPPGSPLRDYIEPLLSEAELAVGDAAFLSAIVKGSRSVQVELRATKLSLNVERP
jgi:hypothetical protein